MKASVVLSCAVALCAVVWGHQGDQERQKRLFPTRCYPGSHCFPDQEDIDIFRDSIRGKVIVPSDSEYPASVEATNLRWTRNPAIVVQAANFGDVRKTVIFTRNFYLNLVYFASGVDYTGRGKYDGGLMLDLSNLKRIEVRDVAANVPGTVYTQVGATWGEIYSKIDATNFQRVVAGGSSSQDSLDTFALSGGVGQYSRYTGLATDSLTHATLVLANGNLARVTPGKVEITEHDGEKKTYNDPDLFDAIRGGGLGFGIPLSFIFKLTETPSPTPSYASITGSYRIVDRSQTTGRAKLQTILQSMASLNRVWGGYVAVIGTSDQSVFADEANSAGQITFVLNSLTSYTWDGNPANANYDANIETLRTLNNRNNQPPTVAENTRLSQGRSTQPESMQQFVEKQNSYVMNALVGSDILTNSTKLDEMLDLMMSTVNAPSVDSQWKCVIKLLGGNIGVSSNSPYVNSKLRTALFDVTCGLSWTEGQLREEFFVDKALEFQTKLRAVSNGGVNGYMASEDIGDWKSALFGANYYKLLDIKKKYDIDNFLWTHNAVASDFELNCRGIRCPHNH